MSVKVGLLTWTMLSLELNEQTAQAYEQLGMDSVWVLDHLLGVVHPELWKESPASALLADPDAFLDPFCVAAAVARKVDMIVGSSVIDITRRRAADFARSALTVHLASRKGFIFGVGSGLTLNLEPYGYETKRRVSKFEETLRELRMLFDTGRMPHGIGRIGLPLESTAGRPQLWVAAHGPRMREITGRYADGWMTSGVAVEQFAKDRSEVLRAAEKYGRPAPVCCFAPFLFFGESRTAIKAKLDAAPLAKLILLFAPASLWKRYGLEHPTGPDAAGYTDAVPHAHNAQKLRETAARIPFEMFDEFVISGNADEISARLEPFVDAGAGHIILSDVAGLAVSAQEAASAFPQYSQVRERLRAREPR